MPRAFGQVDFDPAQDYDTPGISRVPPAHPKCFRATRSFSLSGARVPGRSRVARKSIFLAKPPYLPDSRASAPRVPPGHATRSFSASLQNSRECFPSASECAPATRSAVKHECHAWISRALPYSILWTCTDYHAPVADAAPLGQKWTRRDRTVQPSCLTGMACVTSSRPVQPTTKVDAWLSVPAAFTVPTLV